MGKEMVWCTSQSVLLKEWNLMLSLRREGSLKNDLGVLGH